MIPLSFKNMRVFWKTISVCFSGTVLIEVIQLITKRGIFAIDDILHNTSGAIIGYGLSCFIITIATLKSFKINKKIIVSLSPLFGTIIAFSCIFAIYKLQEFGINTQTYINKIDMKNVSLTCEKELSNDYLQAMVYTTTGMASTKEIKSFAHSFFLNLGAIIDESSTEIYNNRVAYFYAKSSGNETMHLGIDYLAMTYNYELIPSKEESINTVNISEHGIIEKLAEFNIEIPENALFILQDNDTFRIDIVPKIDGSMNLWGWLECTFYDNGMMKSISNHIVKCHAVRMVDIISEQEAFECIKKGMFRYDLPVSNNSINIASVELTYCMDTKGFLIPVYSFSLSDGRKQNIIIPTI
jgi:hypothetical protein